MISLIIYIFASVGLCCLTLYLNKKRFMFPLHDKDEVTDEDCYHANRIGIGVFIYKRFSKIYKELQDYILENGNIPETIPKGINLKNFGKWKAFCEYKSIEETPENIAHKKKWLVRYKTFKKVRSFILYALILIIVFLFLS